CDRNEISDIRLNNLNKLKRLECENNQVSSLEFLKSLEFENLIYLNLNNNNLHGRENNLDLSPFEKFEKLKELRIGNKEKIAQNIYNRFSGSLKFLQHLSDLRLL